MKVNNKTNVCARMPFEIYKNVTIERVIVKDIDNMYHLLFWSEVNKKAAYVRPDSLKKIIDACDDSSVYAES